MGTLTHPLCSLAGLQDLPAALAIGDARLAQFKANANACRASSLRQGSAGVCVEYLTWLMGLQGFGSGIYSVFDANVANNVVALERARGLGVDAGIVGPQVWGALPRAEGSAVPGVVTTPAPYVPTGYVTPPAGTTVAWPTAPFTPTPLPPVAPVEAAKTDWGKWLLIGGLGLAVVGGAAYFFWPESKESQG
ncbi:MAG: hypothetical protein WC718_12815 [Phycisphaerales bacterium]|jgi:hypothetical protein